MKIGERELRAIRLKPNPLTLEFCKLTIFAHNFQRFTTTSVTCNEGSWNCAPLSLAPFSVALRLRFVRPLLLDICLKFLIFTSLNFLNWQLMQKNKIKIQSNLERIFDGWVAHSSFFIIIYRYCTSCIRIRRWHFSKYSRFSSSCA